MKYVLTVVLSAVIGFFIAGLFFATFVKIFGKMPSTNGFKGFNCIGLFVIILLLKPVYIIVTKKLITE